MTNKDYSETIVIGNKTIPIKLQEIDIFDLYYYPLNPRINFILSKFGDSLKQETIEETLWKLDSTKELAADIQKNGGLIEEILVLGNQVIEGNSRLCAYRSLYRNSPDEQKERWKKIRAKVILTTISTKDLFLLLGKLHIKGKTEWDPYEKASYIDKMIVENNMTIEEVAQIVGMATSAINIQLRAFRLMRDGYLTKLSSLQDQKAELKKFSIFEEYFKSSELQNFTTQNADIVDHEKFIQWVKEGRVRSAAYDVKKDLPDILKSKPARKIFLNEAPEDAIQAAKAALSIDHPEKADSFFIKLDQITGFIRNAELVKIKEKLKENPRMVSLIKQFHSEVEKFYRNLEIDNPNKDYIKPLRKK